MRCQEAKRLNARWGLGLAEVALLMDSTIAIDRAALNWLHHLDEHFDNAMSY